MNRIFKLNSKAGNTLAPPSLESCQSLEKSDSNFPKKKNAAKKIIKITLQKKLKIVIELLFDNATTATCEWLLKEARRKFEEIDRGGKYRSDISRIVALKTTKDNLMLDYMLTQPEMTLEILPEKITLQAYVAPATQLGSQAKKTSLQDFEICGCLGRGSFARIYLVRKKLDGKFYAIKQIKKGALDEREIQRLVDERDIMLMGRETGSIQLYSAFQTEDYCYFVMQYCPGGDLRSLLKQRDSQTLSEKEIKYYIKNVLKKLIALHSKGIIHRDLKAENLLLDLKGKVYLADFGLSKLVQSDLNFTICGTPKYYAPELLQNEGYTFSIDYYNVGTLAYLLAVGEAPFTRTKNSKQLFSDIIEKAVHIPKTLSPDLQDFLQQLLAKDPQKRLGSQGIHEIINHIWLKDAPENPPVQIPSTIIEKLVRKIDLENDKAILIDSKTWFHRSSNKKSTRIEGFTIDSGSELEPELESEFELQSFALREMNSEFAFESSKRNEFGSFVSQGTTKGEISHQQDSKKTRSKNEFGSKINIEFFMPSTADFHETVLMTCEIDELNGCYNALELMNDAKYQFKTKSNMKNKKIN